MPRPTLRLAAGAAIGTATIGAAFAAGPVAATSPASTTLPQPRSFAATCDFGRGTSVATVVEIDSSAIPPTAPARTKLPSPTLPVTIDVRFTAEQNEAVFGGFRRASNPAVSLTASEVRLGASVVGDRGIIDYPLSFPLGRSRALPLPPLNSAGSITVNATITSPALTFPAPDSLRWTLADFDLDEVRLLRQDGTYWPSAITPVDSEPTYPPVHCTLDQPGVFATTEITAVVPTPTPTATPPGTAITTPVPTPVATGTPTPTPTVTTPPTPTPGSEDLDPTPVPTRTPTVTPPGTAITTPTPTAAVTLPPNTVAPGVDRSYGMSGSAVLKNLTKGTVPLSGTANLGWPPSTGDVNGALTFIPTSAKLLALGFLPVTADVEIVPLTPAVGRFDTPDTLSLKTTARIKLPNVRALGIPVGGGKDCQTKNPSAIKLASVGSFVPSAGGALSGTFNISDLTGCGFLNGLISPLTAGASNAISLKLTAKQ
ncbi:MAG: hypothetical protein PGN13_02735 [Patulibacter minatonensis]